MRTIVEGKTNVTKLLGKQKLKDVAYRQMRYTLRAECKDGVLLHNVITGHLVLLSAEESALLDSLPAAGTVTMTELIEGYFLVPVEYDEKATVDSLRRILKRLLPPQVFDSYVIFTTTNCNARCFYCYESNYKHLSMDEASADRLVEFMIDHKGSRPIQIQWFGGEPLVGIARIDQISNALRAKGIQFNSTMISNGYLFTEEIAERAAAIWNLKTIQITLDGTEEVYNRTKAYAGVQGSPYQRVLRNIRLLMEKGIYVAIRLNLDRHNSEDLNDLISELNSTFEDKSKLEAVVKVLYENEGYSPIERTKASRAELYRKQVELNTRLESLGLLRFRTHLPSIRANSCMADSPNGIAVFPDGRLFKCEHVMDGDEIGSLFTEKSNDANIEKYLVQAEIDGCPSCPLYPSCLLLKACDGVKDRNQYTCQFDIRIGTQALLKQYENRFKQFSEKSLKSIDISDAIC